MRLSRWLLVAAAGLTLAAAACTTPAPASTATLVPIFAPPAAAATAIAPSPRPSPHPTATTAPRATVAAACENSAAFVEDLTIPDGTEVLPGASLDKRWSVRNTGTCDWGPDYRLVQVGSSDIRGPGEIALYPAKAGSSATWEVAITAPAVPGEYLARWQARAPNGSLFGDEVFVLIVVAEPEPTATPSLAPTP